MATLKITTLDSEPVATEVARYWIPGHPSEGGDRDPAYVIIVAPVTPDNLLAADNEQRYGSVRIIHPEHGVRVVSTLGLGLLVHEG